MEERVVSIVLRRPHRGQAQIDSHRVTSVFFDGELRDQTQPTANLQELSALQPFGWRAQLAE